MQVKLGQEVKCKITGFSGVAIGRTEWINGCARIVVQPKVDKEGKVPDSQHIDEPQLEVIGEGNYRVEEKIEKTGGPLSVPQRQTVSR